MKSKKCFMAGCSLSSYSPQNVGKIVKYLKTIYPDISIIQKCCGKPTKAIGQDKLFHDRFDDIEKDILDCDVDEIIVACQSCANIMKMSNKLKTTSLWALFPHIGLPKEHIGKAKKSDVVFSVHDSCSVRDRSDIHDGIRWILSELGYDYVEPLHTRENTLCCGFGGMIVPVNPSLALRVMKKRANEMPTNSVVTYCAACRQSMLKAGIKAWHILDLVFGDVITSLSIPPKDVLSSPINSWFNRYKSKKIILKSMKS